MLWIFLVSIIYSCTQCVGFLFLIFKSFVLCKLVIAAHVFVMV